MSGGGHSTRRRLFVLLVLTLLVALVSVVGRAQFIDHRPLAGRLDGQEPESHIIVTAIAFTQTSATVHKFLPIFTLGGPYDRYIDQHPGAASSDKSGYYFYTSTPPLTFLLPYLAMGGQPSLPALRWYNVILQMLAASALGWLVHLCLNARKTPAATAWPLTLATVIVYMTAPECLRSHTINLWSQQFYAVLLPLQVILFLFRPHRTLLFLAAFIGCLTDWTAYVANIGMAAVALHRFWSTRERRWLELGAILLLASFAAGVFMIAWFAQAISVASYLHNLAERSGARAAGGLSTFLLFLPRYVESFGLFFALLLVVLLRSQRDPEAPSKVAMPKGGAVDPLQLAIFIWLCALVENLLMKDHALLYSYDRLKGVQLLALALVAIAARHHRLATFTFWSALVVGICSLAFFHLGYSRPGGFYYSVRSQQQLVGGLIARTASSGPVFFDGDVRGSEIYYAGRNIVQIGAHWNDARKIDRRAFALSWLREHHYAQGTLYEISGQYPWTVDRQLPRTLRITHLFTDNRPSVVRTVTLPEKATDYHRVPPSEDHRMAMAPLW